MTSFPDKKQPITSQTEWKENKRIEKWTFNRSE